MKSKDTNFSRRSFIGKTATIAAGITLAGTKVWGAPNYIPRTFDSKFKNKWSSIRAHYLLL
jgi:hypothetical protein